MSLPVIELRQADFTSGSYRVRAPARLVLQEDISFDPTLTRADLPKSGFWFTALSIETLGEVEIDLNGHRFEESRHYLDTNLAQVFSIIEISNSPYAGGGPAFGGNGIFAYRGDTQFTPAGQVRILGPGVLGRSGHWGIHGSNFDSLLVRNVRFRNQQVGGIVVNGERAVRLERVRITGWENDPIVVTPLVTGAYSLSLVLAALAQIPVPGAAEQFAAVQAYVAANPAEFAPGTLPNGAVFGFFTSSGNAQAFGPAGAPEAFPPGALVCAAQAISSQGRAPQSVELCGVRVSALRNAAVETVAIASRISGGFFQNNQIALIITGVFGVLRWNDAFNAAGVFAPNAFLQAQIFALATIIAGQPEVRAFLPPNIDAIILAILTGNETLFFANAQPEFGRNFNVFINRGIFAVRIECAAPRIRVCDLRVNGVFSLGAPGATLGDIFAGERYRNVVVQRRYAGNDAWSYESASTSGARIAKVHATRIFSLNGDAFGGVDLANEVSDTIVRDLTVVDARAPRVVLNEGSTPDERDDVAVNPSGTAYGIRVRNTDARNVLAQLCISQIFGGGDSLPVELERAPRTVLRAVRVQQTVA